MTPYDAHSIPIHVLTMILAQISHTKRDKILLFNEQEIKAPNALLKWQKSFMCNISNDVNNTPETDTSRLKVPIRNWRRQFYIVWCEIIPSKNDYSTIYKGTTKSIEV